MTHECKYEANIAVMNNKIDRILDILEGNGKLGLLEDYNKFKLHTILGFIFVILGGTSSGVMLFKFIETFVR
jgi:hypothetical protein